MFYKKTGICYNRSGNAEARSIYGRFRTLYKHNVGCVIIKAKIRGAKHLRIFLRLI